MDVDSRIREVLSGVLEVPLGSIGENFSRDDAPSWDSLSHLRLVSALEETFGVSFTMQEVGELTSLAAIRQRLADASAGSATEGATGGKTGSTTGNLWGA